MVKRYTKILMMLIISISFCSMVFANSSNEENTLIAVKSGSKYGCIDINGKEIIKKEYSEVKFVKDKILVKKNNKYGLFDMQGNVILPNSYDEINIVSSNVIIVKHGSKFGAYNDKGIAILAEEFKELYYDGGKFLLAKKDKYNFYDLNSKPLTENGFKDAQLFSEGLAAVAKEDKYGYINELGQEVIPYSYKDAKNFCEGLAGVKDKKWNFIDKQGNIVIKGDFDGYLLGFKEGIAVVRNDGNNQYIDNKGAKLFENDYQFFNSFKDGLAEVYVKRESISVIGVLGVVVEKSMNDGSYYADSNDLIDVKFKRGYIDKTGANVIPTRYDYVGEFTNNLCPVVIKDKFGYVNKKGEFVIPAEYQFLGDVSHGYIAAEKNNSYGYVDLNNKPVIPFKFEDGKEFGDKLTAVKMNGKWGYIDNSGEVAIKCQYDNAFNFQGDIAIIKYYSAYGIINNKGTYVLPAKREYEEISSFYNNYASIKVKGKWGVIDQQGKFVITPQYDDLHFKI